MKQPHRYAYAQVRLQAGYARLPPPGYWRSLPAQQDVAGFLLKIQATGLSGWLGGLSSESPAKEIEEKLRRRLRQLILQAAGWIPPDWQAAVRDLQLLPYLPLLDAYWRGELPPEATAADLEELVGQPHQAAPRLALLHAMQEQEREQPLRELWLRAWQPLWRALPGSDALAGLVARVQEHLLQFRQLAPQDAWLARDRLWEDLARLMHRRAFEPVALFAFLLLTALTLEHLRAAWFERLLFAGRRD